jgi:acetyl-CoA carboxylase carboxyl transferase subunit beta
VGYAALRVLQEAEGPELPAGAHTSESHLKAGLIDAVVARPQLRDTIAHVLDLLLNDFRLSAPRKQQAAHVGHTDRVAWQQVQLSRHRLRPTALDFIGRMTTSFVELHGDRTGTDDPAIVAGIGSLGGESAVLIGQVRPHDGDRFGALIHAGGFRKAQRTIALAGKFGLPLVTLIDTAGADLSVEGETDGLGPAIAGCMAAMLEVPSPTVAVIIGEGNSEAAASMAVADRVLMLDNAVYEVIRPEDAAAILYQEAGRAGEAAERLRLTSHDCLRLSIVDATVPEPGDGAHTDHAEAAQLLRRSILRNLVPLQRMRVKTRLEQRYTRYRQIGSTHSWIRGTLERRLAHLADRIGGTLSRIKNRSSIVRRRVDFGEEPDIPV